MRLFTVGGTQSARLLPLAFAGAAVVVAYWFARRLDWRREVSVAAGLVAGLGVLLVPAMLVRDDLKQYTAEACFALLALALTSRLEREWSWRGWPPSRSPSGAACCSANAVAFMGIAAFGAICVVQLARRHWRRLAEAVVAGGCTGVLMLAVYEAFDARAVLPLNASPLAWHYTCRSAGLRAASRSYSHFKSCPLVWPRAGVAGGPAVRRRDRHHRPAGQAGDGDRRLVLWPEMLASRRCEVPVPRPADLDVPVRHHRRRRRDRAGRGVLAAAAVAQGLGRRRAGRRGRGGVRPGAQPYVRSHPIPNEDVRDQARYVATHAAPGT